MAFLFFFVKKAFVLIVVLLFLLLLFALPFLSRLMYTGFATANASFGFQNLAPAWNTIPNQSWAMNTSLTLYLTNYSSDPENYTLVYSSTQPANISVSISNGVVSFVPNTNFVGNRTIIFYVYDQLTLVSSNTVFLTINSSSTPSNGGNNGSGGGSGGSGGGGGGGGGGSGTSSTWVGSLANASNSSDKVVPLPSGGSAACIEKSFSLEDLDSAGILYDVHACYTLYLGSDKDPSLPTLYITLIDSTDELIVVDFTDENGILSQVVLNRLGNLTLDVDADGISDYSVGVDAFHSDNTADLHFWSPSQASFAFFSPIYFSAYWWLYLLLLFFFVFLAFLF